MPLDFSLRGVSKSNGHDHVVKPQENLLISLGVGLAGSFLLYNADKLDLMRSLPQPVKTAVFAVIAALGAAMQILFLIMNL